MMAMRSARWASSSKCVVTTTVTPSLSRTCSRYCHRSLRAPGSRPVEGSSKQQQPRAVQHAGGKLDSAAQAAGERFDQVASAIGEAEAGEHFIGARAQLAAAKAIQPAVVDDVFEDREFFVDAGGLEDNAKLGANRGGAAASRRRSCPRMWTSPCWIGMSVERTRNSVVLPLPLGPRMAKTSRSAMLKREIANRFVLAVPVGKMCDINGGRGGHTEC